MIYLSVAVVAQVDAHPLVLISHRRLAIMADETNIAKKLKSEDLLYKVVMIKYNLPQGTQIYEIAGRLYTKEAARPRRPLQRGPPTSPTRPCRMLRGALLQHCPNELF